VPQDFIYAVLLNFCKHNLSVD